MNNSLDLGKCRTGLVAVCLLLSQALGQREYVAPDSGFRIVFPQGWIVEEGILRAVLIKAMMRDLSDTATITVSKVADKVGISRMTSREVSELYRQQLVGMNYSDIGSGYDSIDGRRTMWMAYSARMNEHAPPRAVITYYFPRDSSVYAVTATVHPRNYERYLSTFRATAASFRPRGEFSVTGASSPGVAVHDDPARGFSLTIPPGWLVKPSFSEDVVFKLVKHHEGFRSGVTVTAVKFSPSESPGGAELDTGSIRALLSSALKAQPQITDLDIHRVDYDLVSGKRAVRAEYTTTYRDQEGKLRRMHQTDLTVLHRSYVLTFGGALGDETDREAFATMVRSVRLYGDTDSRGVTTRPPNVRLVVTPGEKPIPAVVKAFGSNFLKYFLAFLGLGLVGSI